MRRVALPNVTFVTVALFFVVVISSLSPAGLPAERDMSRNPSSPGRIDFAGRQDMTTISAANAADCCGALHDSSRLAEAIGAWRLRLELFHHHPQAHAALLAVLAAEPVT